jgi:hypothetical protein
MTAARADWMHLGVANDVALPDAFTLAESAVAV